MPAWRRGSTSSRALLLAVLLMPGLGRSEDLYLEVFVNEEPRNIITRFTRQDDGSLSADAQDLRRSGILPGLAQSGEVRLDGIPHLGWRLIESEQTIRLFVPDAVLAPHELVAGQNAGGDEAPDTASEAAALQIDRATGLVLNYALGASYWSSATSEDGSDLSGQLDARFFTPFGTLSHGVAATSQQAGGQALRRLDTSWRSSFPSHSVQLQLGDIATRGPAWTRPVRLGGMMIERNYGLRPDLVTIPLAGLEGRADLPSTVEVYSGSVLAYAADVPAGPFSIRDLPLATGSGVARVVLRDIMGKETQADLPFLVTDELLRPGVADFALAAGHPRLGAGTQSDGYADQLFGTATLRYGVLNSVTVSAHAEGGANLAMGGIGSALRLGQVGTASISFAHSQSGGDRGNLVDLAASFHIGSLRASGRLMQVKGIFSDIASLSTDTAGSAPRESGFPREIAQLSLALPLVDATGSGANLFLSNIERADGSSERSIGASYSQMIGRDSSLILTATAVGGAREDRLAAVSLHVPLGLRHSAGASSERNRQGWRHHVRAEGRSEAGGRGWNWRMQADRGERDTIRAGATVTTRLGMAELAGRLGPDDATLGARLEGALVAAGGSVFASRRIDDAFAVVDAGAPGVVVRAENRPVGRTGRSGKILVPDLRAWEDNKISIDPLSLPPEAIMAATETTARPAYRSGAVVDFGVEIGSDNMLVVLVDRDGRPLEVGGRVVYVDRGDEVLVGFDGEVFLTGLSSLTALEVSYPDGRRCRAKIAFNATMTDLREVPCF